MCGHSLTDWTHLTATVKTPSSCVLIVLDFTFGQAQQMNAAGMYPVSDSRIEQNYNQRARQFVTRWLLVGFSSMCSCDR